jgi:hypothetical protein
LGALVKVVWACCEGLRPAGEPCQHKVPLALAPFVIRWGANVSSDMLRQNLRCMACGRRGAALQPLLSIGQFVKPLKALERPTKDHRE